MNREELQKRAKRKAAELAKKRLDTRYQDVISRFVHAGLLAHNTIGPSLADATLGDALWVGEFEPRVLELLPAILLKKPKLLRASGDLPDDLRNVLEKIRKREPLPPFRGIPPDKYLPWVERVGHRGRKPSLLKTYRFSAKDLDLLNQCKSHIGAEHEIEVIRRGLQLLSDSI